MQAITAARPRNFAGNAEAYITLSVDGMQASTPSPPINTPSKPNDQPMTSFAGTKMPLYTTLSPALTTRAAITTIPPLTTRKSPGPGGGIQRSPPAADKPAKIQQSKGGKGSLSSERSQKKADLKDIEVVEETSDTAVLLWRAEGWPSDSPLTVFYFPNDAKDDKETVDIEVGQGEAALGVSDV